MPAATAATTDLHPVRPAANRRPRVWGALCAFLVSVSMLLAVSGVAVFAQSGAAGGPAFVPATAVAYGEIRLDLPGDQHEQLAAFMAHFPGFADPSTFDTKLDQILDQALSSATGGSATWTGNIRTWTNGQVGAGLLALPADMSSDEQPSVVIGVTVTDRAALEVQLATMTTSDVSTEDYSGTTITTSGNSAYAITDQYLLVSAAAADVKVSLDVLAGSVPSLATSADYQAAAGSQPADHLGSFFLSTAALKPLIEAQLGQQAGGDMLVAQLAQVPAWVGGYAQVAADHLTVAAGTQLAAGGIVPAVRETAIAAHFPADTLMFVETRDLGTTVDALLAQLKLQMAADPTSSQTIAGVEQGLGTTLDKLLDFVEDAGVGVSFDGQQLSAGIVATLTDEASGGRRLQTLLGLLQLVSGGADAPLTVTTAEVGGATVTTITLKPSADIPTGLPFEPAASIAISDGYLYLGVGDFAAAALAQDPATSLATAPRYTVAVSAAGTPNAGVVWLDVAAAAPLLVAMGGGADAAYETDVKPWVDVVDSFVATVIVDGDIASVKALLFVK